MHKWKINLHHPTDRQKPAIKREKEYLRPTGLDLSKIKKGIEERKAGLEKMLQGGWPKLQEQSGKT